MEVFANDLSQLLCHNPQPIDATFAWPAWVGQNIGAAVLASIPDQRYREYFVTARVVELIHWHLYGAAFERILIFGLGAISPIYLFARVRDPFPEFKSRLR